ncbi:unnamed protein product [Ixodes persulcatus]
MDISTLAVVVALIAVTAVTAVWWVLNRRHQHGLFRRHGIPGPRPDLLDGNWAQLKEDRIEVGSHFDEEIKSFQSKEQTKKGTFQTQLTGLFLKQPVYTDTATPTHHTDLCVVGESGFVGIYRYIKTQADPTTRSRKVFECRNESTATSIRSRFENCKWVRAVRERHFFVLSPIFMVKISRRCTVAAGVDCQKNPNDPLLLSIRKMFLEADDGILRQAIRFPILCKIISSLISFTSYIKTLTRIFDNVRQVIELRRKGQSPRTTDMLQMMLDAQAGILDNTNNTGQRQKLMEDRHLVGNCFIFLAAGYETTATSLAFVIHLLAKYPEEQDRILNELNKVFPGKDQDLTYDGVHELKRLDMVICESLRLYPPVVLFVSRHCRENTTIMGQFIPAEANIIVPTWHIHHDPEHWPEPFKFDPERFAEGLNTGHSAAYLPFGLGPRVCIGKRFALLEIKMALCKLIRKYRIRQCKETQDPVKLVVPTAAINPEKGISVKFEHR